MSDLRLRARSVTEIVDATFQLYRRDPLQYLLVTAIVYAPVVIVQILLRRANASVLDSDAQLRSAILFPLALIGFAVITSVLYRFSSEVYLGREPDIATIIRLALRRIPSVLGASILVWLLMAVGLAPGGIALALRSFIVGGVLLFLGAFWCLYVFLRCYAVIPALLIEEIGAIDALRRSWALSRQRKGAVFLTYLLIMVIVMLLGAAIGVAALVGQSLVLVTVLQGLVNIVTYPLFAIATVLLYYDARIRDEGLDIQLMADSIAASPTAA